MRHILNEEDFLNGTVAIKVKSLDESKYLINLALESGYPKEGSEPMIENNTYLEYPYYFIEQDNQLQATMYRANLKDLCYEVCVFETIFGELL